MKTQPPRLVIPLLDYQRIFRVINSVVTSLGNDSNENCLFFSVAGAAILQRFYGKEARVLVGSAYYLLDDATSGVLALTKFEDGQLDKGITESGPDGFHAWLECEGKVIDFQAPVFPEALHRTGIQARIPRKMFQKARDRMSTGPGEHYSVGDFYLAPNLALTNLLVPRILQHELSLSMIKVCMSWYVPPPKPLPRNFAVQGDTGNVVHLELSDIGLVGAW